MPNGWRFGEGVEAGTRLSRNIFAPLLQKIKEEKARRDVKDQELIKAMRMLERIEKTGEVQRRTGRAAEEERRITGREKFERERPFKTKPTTFLDLMRPPTETMGMPIVRGTRGTFITGTPAEGEDVSGYGRDITTREFLERTGFKAKGMTEEGRMAISPEVESPSGILARRTGLTTLRRNQLLGTLMSGYYNHPLTNQRLPLRTKQQARDYLLQRGYMDYQDDPEIMQILNNLPSQTTQTPRRGLFLGLGRRQTEVAQPESRRIFPFGRRQTQTQPQVQTGTMGLAGAERRFNELVTQGVSEDEAYRQLMNEGF